MSEQEQAPNSGTPPHDEGGSPVMNEGADGTSGSGSVAPNGVANGDGHRPEPLHVEEASPSSVPPLVLDPLELKASHLEIYADEANHHHGVEYADAHEQHALAEAAATSGSFHGHIHTVPSLEMSPMIGPRRRSTGNTASVLDRMEADGGDDLEKTQPSSPSISMRSIREFDGQFLKHRTIHASVRNILSNVTVTLCGNGEKIGPEQLKSSHELQQLLSKVDEMDRDTSVWLDVQGLDYKLLDIIGEKFSLHPLTVEDCGHYVAGSDENDRGFEQALEREKLEIFEDEKYAYLQYHASDEDWVFEEYSPVKLIIFRNVLITMHHVEMPLFKPMIERAEVKIPSVSWLVYQILKAITTRFFAVVETIIYEVDSLERLSDILSGSERHDLLKRMVMARRHIVTVRSTLVSKMSIIQRMMASREFFDNVHYLHDLYDHLSIMFKRLEGAHELLESLQTSYTAKVSLDVASLSNELTSSMNRLTLAATLVMPMTLVAGLWGMNVTVPGQNDRVDDPHYGWFFGIVGCMIAAMMTGMFFFKRRGYM